MALIKIKRLTVSGPNVITSSIEFGSRLTIITGPSDSGKTYIYKCIDYVLGAKNDSSRLPIDLQEGYDTIELIISTNKGNIKLTRKVNSNDTSVESEIEEIVSGVYLIEGNKNNAKTMNILLLNILNVPHNIKLPKNKKGDTASFTWRLIKQAFMVDEQNADNSDSVLYSRYDGTLFLASLIYLLNDDELSDYKSDDESEIIRKTKRKAIIEYINKQRKILNDKKSKFNSVITEYSSDKSLDEQIKEINYKLNDVNQKIDDASIKNKEITTSLIKIQSSLSREVMTMSRYEKLKSQYETDIGRLTFIVENDVLTTGKKPNTKCPFCENNITPHDHTSYIAASQAELIKLINNLNDLEDTKIELQNNIDDNKDYLRDYKEQSEEINNLLKKELVPQRNQITSLLQNYREAMQIEGALLQFKDLDLMLEEDIKEYEKDTKTTFKPFESKQLFYDLISSEIQKNSEEILTKIGYLPLDSVVFDKKNIDIIVNDKNKNTHGKGYKSFFNSILLLSLMKFITEHSNRNPGFYIYDSPLKGLSLSDEVINENNIRIGYFNYLFELDTGNQIIIMENSDKHELPIHSPSEDTIIYEFTQIEGKGRYGFLQSVKRK